MRLTGFSPAATLPRFQGKSVRSHQVEGERSQNQPTVVGRGKFSDLRTLQANISQALGDQRVFLTESGDKVLGMIIDDKIPLSTVSRILGPDANAGIARFQSFERHVLVLLASDNRQQREYQFAYDPANDELRVSTRTGIRLPPQDKDQVLWQLVALPRKEALTYANYEAGEDQVSRLDSKSKMGYFDKTLTNRLPKMY